MITTISSPERVTDHELDESLAELLRDVARPLEQYAMLVTDINRAHTLLDRIGAPRTMFIFGKETTLTLSNRIEELGRWLRENVGELPLDMSSQKETFS